MAERARHRVEVDFLAGLPKGEGFALMLFMAGLPFELAAAAGITGVVTAPEEMSWFLSAATGACLALAISLPFLGGCLFYRDVAKQYDGNTLDTEDEEVAA